MGQADGEGEEGERRAKVRSDERWRMNRTRYCPPSLRRTEKRWTRVNWEGGKKKKKKNPTSLDQQKAGRLR